MFTVADFRAAFPAFSDAAKYPTSQINFWIGLSALMFDPFRWGKLIDYGQQLFVAHNMSLDAQSAAAGNGIPGAVSGAVTSANVDKVGYSRDPGAAMDPSNGHWNLTTFGLRYVKLMKMVGAGPVQVGAPAGPGGWWATNGDALRGWPGVIPPTWG